HQQQDVELDKLFMDVATYNCRVMGPSHVERVTDLACRTALTYRGVAHITIPVDMQDMPAGEHRSKRNVQARPSEAPPRTTQLPETNDLEAAAAILNEGERVVILAGQGALHATDELEALAELLGAPIVKALLGKAAVPDDSPYTTG